MDSQWIFRKNIDSKISKKFAEELQVPEIIANILLSRNVDTYQEAVAFLKPSADFMHDPFLMKGMNEAVDRILMAVKNKEKIIIYGDYDVDGVTSTAVLYILLKEMGGEVSFYIPERIKEGYGLSINGIKEGINRSASLMISVDCGITNHKEISFAKENKLDFIICDHHEPLDELPGALSILNPKQKDDNYPFKELAGVGVVFKLIQGIIEKTGSDPADALKFIDIVAIGTSADVVPLLGENRFIVKKGIEKIMSDPSLGVMALLETSGMINAEIKNWNIIYRIAPRINAGGRIGSAEKSVQLLITNDINEALSIANILENQNRKRKSIDENILKDALELVEERFDPKSDYSIVLAKENWHLGVIGICASRIVERFYRPTVMISISDGIGKGSARSIPEFDIYSALKECSEIMAEFGGHKLAAGLTIREENIDKFVYLFEEIVRKKLTHNNLVPKLKIDGYIVLDDINEEIVRMLKYFEPYGPENEKPLFAARNLQVVDDPKVLKNNHLKFKVRDHYVIFDAIGFGMGNLKYRLEPGAKNLDMAFNIDENYWCGKKSIQLKVKDLK